MTAPSDDPNRGEESARSADEEYADAYSDGYREGVRSALREVLQHVSRGHTAQELRILIESRLARLNEEVDLKRKSLLSPPRRPAWGPLLRPPTSPRVWAPPIGGAAPAAFVPGFSYLVKEERPQRALDLLRGAASGFPRIVVISLHPPALPGVAPDVLATVPLGTLGPGREGSDTTLSPGEISGRLRAPTEAEGGALLYFDALEFFVTEFGLETTLRFIHWLVGQVQTTRSMLVVSLDPAALELKDLSRLQRAFNSVL